MDTALTRAQHRLQVARHILAQLHLMERWSAFGSPVLVGAAAYGLVVAPDIDVEIFCDKPTTEDGFDVLRTCALHPQIRKARFANELHGPDTGLYWQLRYVHDDGQEWKIDMWSLRHDHPGPYAAALVEPMKQALTDHARRAILALKEQKLRDPTLQCGSIHIYRAVLDDGIRDVEQFKAWLEQNQIDGLTTWQPRT
ncbi:MAG: hypothetical protein MI924_14805 [Chloroflexales bacterium]|nr:hypothetical protein [Chloroflexales bacterium]